MQFAMLFRCYDGRVKRRPTLSAAKMAAHNPSRRGLQPRAWLRSRRGIGILPMI